MKKLCTVLKDSNSKHTKEGIQQMQETLFKFELSKFKTYIRNVALASLSSMQLARRIWLCHSILHGLLVSSVFQAAVNNLCTGMVFWERWNPKYAK